MATTKKRFNITLSSDMEEQVTALAQLDQVPTATKISELLRASLQLEEDRLLSTIGDERVQTSTGRLTHEQVWGTD